MFAIHHLLYMKTLEKSIIFLKHPNLFDDVYVYVASAPAVAGVKREVEHVDDRRAVHKSSACIDSLGVAVNVAAVGGLDIKL